MKLLIAIVLLCGSSCAEPHPIDPAPDGGAPLDAAVIDAGAPIARCGGRPLVFSRTEAETTAALADILADVRAQAPTAYYREAIDGTRADATLTGMGVDLAIGPDHDPRPAAIAWLAAASPATFAADEWSIDPLATPIDPALVEVGDVMYARMARTTVDGEAWPSTYPARWVEGGGLALIIAKTTGGWALRTVTLTPATALATADDATLLAGCAPPRPGPEGPLRAHVYRGLELDGCGVVGEYSYAPTDDDLARWVPGLGFTLAEVVEGRARWRGFAQVELTIAPANYWPRIGYADCTCGDRAGFTLRVDAVTGALLRVTPAINCVVC